MVMDVCNVVVYIFVQQSVNTLFSAFIISSENKVKVADVCFTVKLLFSEINTVHPVCPSDEGGCNGEEFSLYF